jgi:hypothetical protein
MLIQCDDIALTHVPGHCYLMTENLQKAYDAYQQALVNLRDPKVRMVKSHLN